LTSPALGRFVAMRSRPKGFVLATSGLGVLIFVLLATPDATGWVLLAWLVVIAAVSAVALGVALGFRHQASLDTTTKTRAYVTADWLQGAQLFTLGDRAEPPAPEPLPQPVVAPSEPVTIPHPVPGREPEPELEPAGAPVARRLPAIAAAAALIVASAVRQRVRPGRATR
jgi:hypothetical protein